MLKKLKWVLFVSLAIGIIVLTYIINLVRYAETEVTALASHAAAVEAMPEVISVRSIHRFNGIESYIVARVEHEIGQDVYLFVREGRVRDYFISALLIDERDAIAIAERLIQDGEIIRTQLGRLEEMPIFEVQIRHEEIVHYIVIHAQTSEIVLNFYL